MRTAEQRIAKYNRRMAAGLLDPVRSAQVAAQIANFTTYEVEFYPIQVACRQLLSGAGVNLIDIGQYEAFIGEMYHITKVVTGEALAEAAANLVTKWSDTNHLGAGAAALLNSLKVDGFHIDVAPITP